MDLVFLSDCIPPDQALGMHFAQPHFLDPSHCFDLFLTGMWSLQPCILSECEKAILPEVDLPHDLCVTTSFVYKFPRVCVLARGTRLVTWPSCTNCLYQPKKGNLHGLAAPQGGSSPCECTWASCLKPASLPLDASTLLQSKGLTCILYPPCFCKLGIRRDGLSFTYGDIFHKRHGRDIDIWTLKIIVGSNGSL